MFSGQRAAGCNHDNAWCSACTRVCVCGVTQNVVGLTTSLPLTGRTGIFIAVGQLKIHKRLRIKKIPGM